MVPPQADLVDATPHPVRSETALPEAGLCVLAGDEALRLPLRVVREVLRPPALTRMPHAPFFLLGLCNLRGTVLPVVSLRALRDGRRPDTGARADAAPGARIVVVSVGSNRVGLAVDAVPPNGNAAAQEIDPAALLPMPSGQDRRFPAGRAGEAADRRSGAGQADNARTAMLGFLVGGREFALCLDAVLSVASLETVATPNKVPGTDAAMLGVVPSRNRLLPVLDAGVLLGLERPGHGARMVVARIDGRVAALAVDAITGVLRPPVAAIEPVPPLLLRGLGGEARIEAICRMDEGRRLVQLLHPDRLLDAATMGRLAEIGAEADEEVGRAGPATMAPDGASEQVLLFRIGPERYGLPIAAVVEVVRHPDSLVLLPNAPALVSGVITLRGRVLPVIDGRRRFEAEAGAAGARRRIVVVSAGRRRLGLAVDQASDTARFPAAALSPAPGFGTTNALFDRIATPDRGGMVPLVDPAALLDGVGRDMLDAAMRTGKQSTS